MKLWFLTYDCRDYYCEGNHPVGVFTSPDLVNDVEKKHREEREKHFSTPYEYTITEIETDVDLNW